MDAHPGTLFPHSALVAPSLPGYHHPVKIEPPSTPSTGGQISSNSSINSNDGALTRSYSQISSCQANTIRSEQTSLIGSQTATYQLTCHPESASSSISSIAGGVGSTDSHSGAQEFTVVDAETIKDELDQTISETSRQRLDRILTEVDHLSETDRLLLYLRLPSAMPPSATESLPTGEQLAEPGNSMISLNLSNQLEQSQAFTWILSHLEEDLNTCLRKDEVFDDYRAYCDSHNFKPLNTADFGKVMKRAFPNVKPRRLGQRGQSKYCYGGMRKKLEVQPPSLPDITEEMTNQDSSHWMTGSTNNRMLNGPGIESEGDAALQDSVVGVEANMLVPCCQLVLEYSEKLLGRHFTSLGQLSEHLVRHMYVNTRSRAALALVAALQERGTVGPRISSLPNSISSKIPLSSAFSPTNLKPIASKNIKIKPRPESFSPSSNPPSNRIPTKKVSTRRNSGSTGGSDSHISGHHSTPSTPGSQPGCPGTPQAPQYYKGSPQTPTACQMRSLSPSGGIGRVPPAYQQGGYVSSGSFQQLNASTGGNYSTPRFPGLSSETCTPTVSTAAQAVPANKPHLMSLPPSITKDTFSSRRPDLSSSSLTSLSSSPYPASVGFNISSESSYLEPQFPQPMDSSFVSQKPIYSGPPTAHSSYRSSLPHELPPAPPPLQWGGKSPYQQVSAASLPNNNKRVCEPNRMSDAPGAYDPSPRYHRLEPQSPSKRARYFYTGVQSDNADEHQSSIQLNGFYGSPRVGHMPTLQYPGRYGDLGMLSPLPISKQEQDYSSTLGYDPSLPRLGASPEPQGSGYPFYSSFPRCGSPTGPSADINGSTSAGSTDSTEEPTSNPHDDLHTPTLPTQGDEDQTHLPTIGLSPRPIRNEVDEISEVTNKRKHSKRSYTIDSSSSLALSIGERDNPTGSSKMRHHHEELRSCQTNMSTTATSLVVLKPCTPEERRVTSTTSSLLSPPTRH